jgi:hypothetical protein
MKISAIPKELEGLDLEGFVNGKGISDSVTKNVDRIDFFRKQIRKFFTPTRTIIRNHTSYEMKHNFFDYLKATNESEQYIDNGVFIYAMYLEGYKIEAINKNAYFNINSKDFDVLANAPKILQKLKAKGEYSIQSMVDFIPNYQMKYKYNIKYIIDSKFELEPKLKKLVIPYLSKELGIEENELRFYTKLVYSDDHKIEEASLEKLANIIEIESSELVNSPNSTTNKK